MTVQLYYIAFGVITLALSIWLNLIITHRYILKNKYINHSKHWWWKALASLPAIVLFSLGVWNNVQPVFALGVSAIMVMVWFMTFFDGIYGLRVGGDFFYTGTQVGKGKAKTDGFFRSLPRWARAAVKVALCAVSLYAYIKMIEN